jgi:hypothetical protein
MIGTGWHCDGCGAYMNSDGHTSYRVAEQDLRADVARLTAERDLAGAQMLMVASQVAADPKIDPLDTSDPRWTPALADVARLIAERDKARAALSTMYDLLRENRVSQVVTMLELMRLEKKP